MNDEIEKAETSKGLAESAPASSCQFEVNDSRTCEKSDTHLTQPRSGFDLEDVRRGLIATRVIKGAESPDGHTCSNLVELLPHAVGYVAPPWATHEFQTVPGLIKRQMRRFGKSQ